MELLNEALEKLGDSSIIQFFNLSIERLEFFETIADRVEKIKRDSSDPPSTFDFFEEELQRNLHQQKMAVSSFDYLKCVVIGCTGACPFCGARCEQLEECDKQRD